MFKLLSVRLHFETVKRSLKRTDSSTLILPRCFKMGLGSSDDKRLTGRMLTSSISSTTSDLTPGFTIELLEAGSLLGAFTSTLGAITVAGAFRTVAMLGFGTGFGAAGTAVGAAEVTGLTGAEAAGICAPELSETKLAWPPKIEISRAALTGRRVTGSEGGSARPTS